MEKMTFGNYLDWLSGVNNSTSIQSDDGSNLCSCGNPECQYTTVAAMSGFERHQLFVELSQKNVTNSFGEVIGTEYTDLMALLVGNHPPLHEVCLCYDYDTYLNNQNYKQKSYGSLNHSQNVLDYNMQQLAYCPWHFSQISMDDKVTLLSSMEVEERYSFLNEWYTSAQSGNVYGDFVAEFQNSYPNSNLICTCSQPLPMGDSNHDEDCRWKLPEKTLTNEVSGTKVEVTGNIPADVSLSLVPIDPTNVLPEFSQLGENLQYVALDVKLLQGNTEWQPGEKVQVTISAEKLGENGETVALFHKHGDKATEILGAYQIKENKLTFEMSGFSYLLGVNVHNVVCWIDDLADMTIQQRYDFLTQQTMTAFWLFMEHYVVEHSDTNLVCTCGFSNTNMQIFAPGAENHKSGCPWAFVNLDEKPLEEEVVGADGTTTTISVAGNNVDLEGKTLKATAATKDNVIALFAADDPFALMLDAMQNKHKVFDITMFDGAQKWQPGENQSVEVTMSVDDLDTGNDDMLVYHIHADENGNVTEPELMGPFKADENGNIKFQMEQFSYVMVLNSNLKIENVEVFYPVNTYADSGTFPQSTNGNWCIIGVYYDTNQNAHVLIGQITNNINNDKVQSVTVNGTVIPNNDNNITRYLGNISKITKDTTNGEELVSFENVSKNQINGVWDVDCGKLPMAQVFELSLESNGGFAIGKTEYTLHLEYEISKVVGAGTDDSATFGETVSVDRGDWVIFQINVDNIGTQPLENMKVQDILPTDIFDMSTVQMSIDGENGAVGNWVDFNQTLFENYNSEGGFSRLLYVRGQINPNLPFNAQPITRENTVTIDGMNMPTASDTATVVINPSKNGTLKVSKTITSANPQDPAPADAAFTFKLDANPNVSTVNSFSYTLSNGTSGTVQNGGTFVLGNGQSAEFDGFPAGSFTITEVDNTGYSTKVNGVSGTSYTGTIGTTETDKAPVVAFENQFNMRVAALNIVKKLVGGKNTDVFTFTIKLENQTVGDDGTVSYGGITFTKAEDADPNTAGNYDVFGTVQITGAGSKQIELPNNTKVTVTETEHPDYILSSDNNQEVTITLGTPKTVTFVNTYKTAPLTINKKVVDANGAELTSDKEFDVQVTLKDANGAAVNKTYKQSNGSDVVFTNGVANVKVKPGTPVVIEEIEYGYTYAVTETSELMTGYRLKEYDAKKTGSMTADGAETTITNYATRSMTVKKTVEGLDAIKANERFAFELTFNSTMLGEQPFTFSLKNGETRTFENIPVGTTFTLTEKLTEAQKAKYVTPVINGTAGEALTNAALNANAPDVYEVVNTYKTGSLTVTKTVSGDVEEGQRFIFTVTSPNNYSAELVLGAGQSITLTNLPYGNYTVTENTNWAGRYQTDTNNPQQVTVDKDHNPIASFTNTRKTSNQWLDANAGVTNNFSKNENGTAY